MKSSDRKTSLLADPAILVALTFLVAALLGWPMIQIAGERGTAALFVYIFAIWGGLVVLLYGVARGLRADASAAADSHDPGGRQP